MQFLCEPVAVRRVLFSSIPLPTVRESHWGAPPEKAEDDAPSRNIFHPSSLKGRERRLQGKIERRNHYAKKSVEKNVVSSHWHGIDSLSSLNRLHFGHPGPFILLTLRVPILIGSRLLLCFLYRRRRAGRRKNAIPILGYR